jgi:nucleoid-associated protein YgaU
MKKELLFLMVCTAFLCGCANLQKKQPEEKTREEIIDMKLKQILAISETSLEASKKAEKLSTDAVNTSNEAKANSREALKASNTAVEKANEAREFAASEVQKAITAANKASKMSMQYADNSANKAIKAANEAIEASNQSSEKSISVANQTIAEINRVRATVKMKEEQELPILEDEPEVKKTYEIKQGDTLSSIAVKFYRDSSKWKLIYRENKNAIKNPDVVVPGTKIVIP